MRYVEEIEKLVVVFIGNLPNIVSAFDQLRQRIKHIKMKSKITIEVDFDNNNLPVIQILSQDSDDVRDRLIKSFLQSLQHTSRWCKITYCGEASTFEDATVNKQRWRISPITPNELGSEIQLMQAELKCLKDEEESQMPTSPDK